MLTEPAFKLGMSRLDAAGIKTYPQESRRLLYEELRALTDYNFNIIITEFLENDKPPHLVAFAKRRNAEINTPVAGYNQQGWYEEREIKMYVAIIGILAQKFYKKDKDTYQSLCGSLEKIFCTENRKSGMLEFCQEVFGVEFKILKGAAVK